MAVQREHCKIKQSCFVWSRSLLFISQLLGDVEVPVVDKVIEELTHVVNAAEVITSGLDTADSFCQDMKAFSLHVQPEGAQSKVDIEQAVDRLGSSDLFRGLKVFDSGFAVAKRAKDMVPQIEALHATTAEFKAWLAETSVSILMACSEAPRLGAIELRQ